MQAQNFRDIWGAENRETVTYDSELVYRRTSYLKSTKVHNQVHLTSLSYGTIKHQ